MYVYSLEIAMFSFVKNMYSLKKYGFILKYVVRFTWTVSTGICKSQVYENVVHEIMLQ